MRPISPQQELFIQYYVEGKSATQAAIDSGYSPRAAASTAHVLLRNPKIDVEIQKRKEQLKQNAIARANHKGVTLERWTEEVAALAFSDVTQAFSTGPDGKLTMSLAELKASGFGRLIRKLKVHPNGKVEFELHPKLPGLELLAKHYGWIKDQVQHSGSITAAGLPADSIQKIFSDPQTTELARELALRMSQPPAIDVDGPGEGESIHGQALPQ